MTAYKGSLVLIKIGDGAATENFSTIGGLQICSLALGNQTLDASNVSSGNWRQLLAGGMSSLRISGSGLFTNSAAEALLRGYAFANSINNYQFIFANGDRVAASCQITQYERSGNMEAAETYNLTLESAGAVSLTNAS